MIPEHARDNASESEDRAGRKPRKKTIYALRIRPDESVHWYPVEYYRTRKERDHDERMNRIIGGIRTHSYDEKKTTEEIEAIFAD